jgi:DNA invertase Pin-like site-specific DNA recombinase
VTLGTHTTHERPPSSGLSQVRVIGYLRCSTEEQRESGLGLEAQRAAITAEAERRGWPVEFIEDAGFSAKDLRRPGIQYALSRLQSGSADVLCVSRLDRLSRSMFDFTSLMATASAEGWSVVALDLGVDTTTAEGELMANVRASFGAYERRLIGQRTREALAARRAAGHRLGRAPVVSDVVAHRAKTLRASGLKLREIGDVLAAEGHQAPSGRWHPPTIHKLLQRP